MRRHFHALRPAVYSVVRYRGVPTYYVYHTLRLNQGKSEAEDFTTKSAKGTKAEIG
jgi:hypothetical protein